MTKYMDEGISAFFDGELGGEETQQLLNHLCKDDVSKQRWERYQLASDALRNNLPPAISLEFSRSVMQAIDAEPTIVAAPKVSPSVTSAKVGVEQDKRSISKIALFNNAALMKKATGVAIAASVAAVALLSYQIGLQQQPGMGATQMLADQSQSHPAVNQVNPLASTVSVPQQPLAAAPRGLMLNPQAAMQASSKSSAVVSSTYPLTQHALPPQKPPFNAQLHKYIINHNQHFSGTRIQGVLPYARIVASPANSGPAKQNQSTQGQQ